MRNWFNNLENKYKKMLIWGTWIIFVISLFMFDFVPEGEHELATWEWILAYVFLASLIFGILFVVWNKKYKQEMRRKQKLESVNQNKPKVPVNNSIGQETLKPPVFQNKNSNAIKLLENLNLTFIDVETPNRSNNKICSIALINKEKGQITYKQNLYVNPETRFDDLNMQIHGISPTMVENAPKFNEVWKDISKYFINTIVVGHNVTSDLNIISKTLNSYGLTLNTITYLDTYTLAKKYMYAKSYKLSDLTTEFNIKSQAHDALSDCVDCENLLNKIVSENKLNLYAETEEFYIQHKNVSEPTVYGRIRNTKETLAYQKIQDSISKILEDNNVSNDELKTFINEVENSNLKETYPISKAYQIAIDKLNNVQVDIKKSLSAINGDIDGDYFDGDFEDKIFCLTGDFNHGAKNEVADYIISQGGIVKDSLTLKVDYLVRGLQGSEDYAYGSYGTKVKRALEMQDKGHSIKIITEDDIY